jgi:hypothetical protein
MYEAELATIDATTNNTAETTPNTLPFIITSPYFFYLIEQALQLYSISP